MIQISLRMFHTLYLVLCKINNEFARLVLTHDHLEIECGNFYEAANLPQSHRTQLQKIVEFAKKMLNSHLLLSGPQPSDTLPVEFDDPEGYVTLVEHDDLVLISTIVNHVT